MANKSQMPKSARQPLQAAWDRQGLPGGATPNMAEKHVDAAQRQQAMEFLQRMMAGKGGYTPIIKSLKAIGVEPRTMDVMIGDEPEECLVIPVAELMAKEWRHMSELDAIKEAGGQE